MKNQNKLHGKLDKAVAKRVWDFGLFVRLSAIFVFSLALWPGNMLAAPVADAHYDRLMRVDEFKKYDKAAAHEIQQNLAIIYHDDPDFLRDVALGHKPLTDDIVGPITLFWMQRFCYTFRIAPIGDFTDGLIASIADFSGFATRHPKEKLTILSHDFGHWVDTQAAPQKSADYDILRSGTDAQRLALVEQYLKRKPIKPPKPAVIKTEDQRLIYAYRLEAEDLDTLRGKPNLMKALASFPSKPFADVAEFDAAITAALKDISPETIKRYLPTIEEVARIDGYRLTDLSLQKLEDLAVPDDLVHAIEPMQGTFYQDEDDIKEALKSTVAESKPKPKTPLEKYQPQILAAAEIGTYSLGSDALKKLSDKLSADQKKPIIPVQVINILTQLENVNYPTAELFGKAVQAKIEESLGACPENTPDYAKYVRSLILKDADYKDLQSAVTESVSASASGTDASKSDDLGKQFDTVSTLRKLAAVCTFDQTSQGQTLAADIYTLYKQAISDVSRKAPATTSTPIQWSGGPWGMKSGAVTPSCGCVLDDLSGVVYAFFPFWLEPPKAAPDPNAAKRDGKQPDAASPQVLDFNVLSRIGFVGFTFDDKGNLTPSVGRSDTGYDFTHAAHTFQTQMDWVIRKDDWAAWMNLSEQEQSSYFNNLNVNILDLLKRTDGNGITLFFDGYPDNENDAGDSIILFDQFVDNLNKSLHASGKKYGLNIVLRQPEVVGKDNSAGATARMNSYEHMLKLLGLINPNENRKATWKSGNQVIDWFYSLVVPQPTSATRNHILILIEEPTTNSKKRLRLEIEQSLHGEERHQLLSGIIPVIEFDGRNWEQLEDDIIYFKDNFDGIGFWPVNFHQASGAVSAGKTPIGASHCNQGETVEQCLVKTYQGANLNGVEDNMFDKFVCQYHIWFRVLFCAFLSIFLLAYLVPIFTCHLRGWIQRNFILLAINLGLMVVVGALLFSWDPDLEGTRAHVVIVAGLLALGAVEMIRRHYEFFARTVKPSRAKEASVNKSPFGSLETQAMSAKDNAEQAAQQKQRENAFLKKVLKAVKRLRTYLDGGDEAQGSARIALRNDLNHVDDYLQIEKQERSVTRNKIRKSMQVVIDNLNQDNSSGVPGVISQRKIQRVVKLVWYYLNRNIPAERQLMASIEPIMDQLDRDVTLNNDDLAPIRAVLTSVQEYLDSRDKSESGVFTAMWNAITLMTDALDHDGQQQVSSRDEIRAAMQVVWRYLDQDPKLHGTAAAGTISATHATANAANAVSPDTEPPIIP